MKEKPSWWLERPHALDLTPEDDTPTFKESDLYTEWLKRGYADVMSFDDYKNARCDVLNLVEER